MIAAKGPKRALVYFGANAGPGRVRPGYLKDILAAARTELPREGIEALERLGGEAPLDRAPRTL